MLLRLREAAVSGAVLVASPPTGASVAVGQPIVARQCFYTPCSPNDAPPAAWLLERSHGSSALLLPAKNDSSRADCAR